MHILRTRRMVTRCSTHKIKSFDRYRTAFWGPFKQRPSSSRNGSVRLTVRSSVCLSPFHIFFTMFFSSCHHEIFRCNDRNGALVGDQGQRLKAKVTEIKTNFALIFIFNTVTPIWIHRWLRNVVHSSKWHGRGVILFVVVVRLISSSHGTKIDTFDPNWAFPDCNFSSLNSSVAMKWTTKLQVVKEMCANSLEVIWQISRSWLLGWSQLSNPSDLPVYYGYNAGLDKYLHPLSMRDVITRTCPQR